MYLVMDALENISGSGVAISAVILITVSLLHCLCFNKSITTCCNSYVAIHILFSMLWVVVVCVVSTLTFGKNVAVVVVSSVVVSVGFALTPLIQDYIYGFLFDCMNVRKHATIRLLGKKGQWDVLRRDTFTTVLSAENGGDVVYLSNSCLRNMPFVLKHVGRQSEKKRGIGDTGVIKW